MKMRTLWISTINSKIHLHWITEVMKMKMKTIRYEGQFITTPFIYDFYLVFTFPPSTRSKSSATMSRSETWNENYGRIYALRFLKTMLTFKNSALHQLKNPTTRKKWSRFSSQVLCMSYQSSSEKVLSVYQCNRVS